MTYRPDDAVELGGSSYVAVDPIRGVAPPDNGWNLLARRGAQGPSGLGGGGVGVALSNAIPLVESGSGSAGTGIKASKDDHAHPLGPGGGGGSDDQTAAEVPFTPAGTISATDTQAAVEEVATDAAGALSTHAADTTAVHGIADTSALVLTGDARLSDSRPPNGGAGGVLSGLYPNPGFAVDMAEQAELDAHVNDATAAHAASAVGFTPAGTIAATNVQAAIEEVAAEASSGTQDIEEVLTEGDDAGGRQLVNVRQVTINPDGSSLYGLLVQALPGFSAVYSAFARFIDENGVEFFNLDVGGIDFIAPTGQGQSHAAFAETDTAATGQVSSRGFSFLDGSAQLAFSSGQALRFKAFVPSEMPSATYAQVYYDATDGAAYMRFRGKTADGTDVAGRVRLGATVQTYTETNVTTDRAFNANSTTLDEIADVLGTLIADLRAQGVVA